VKTQKTHFGQKWSYDSCKLSRQIVSVSTLLLDDTLKPATPLTNAFKIVAFKTLTFHKVVSNTLEVW